MHKLIDAIRVVLLTGHIRDYLADHDPMALRQLHDALKSVNAPLIEDKYLADLIGDKYHDSRHGY